MYGWPIACDCPERMYGWPIACDYPKVLLNLWLPIGPQDETITKESPVGSGQGRSETLLEEFQLWLGTKNYASTDHTILLTG